jgi:quercetin dioxygenase-like cupin family protein
MIIRKSAEKPVRATAHDIKRRALLFGSLLAPLLITGLITGTAMATPGQGVSQTSIASGALPVPIRVKWSERPRQYPGNPHGAIALGQHGQPGEIGVAMQTGAGEMGFGNGLDVSNISIVKNVVQPGGYFGWHQHSGPSWIVVTQGTLTFYSGGDPTCTGHPVSAGSAYLDPGDHTHNARNETNQVVENYVVRMLPAGGPPRIDMPDPGVCPGLP